MYSLSVNRFRSHLKQVVEQVISSHVPIKVTRRSGEAFVVMSADDWEREQETLYVLQNSELMKQIAESASSHGQDTGHTATDEQVNEITRL